jgi:hypothetical protein
VKLPLSWTVGGVLPACSAHELKLTGAPSSAQDVKVSEVRVAVSDPKALALPAAVAAKEVPWQVNVPVLVARTARSDAVLLNRVEPERSASPGSVRRYVAAEAEPPPSTSAPTTAITAAAASLRTDISSSSSPRRKKLTAQHYTLPQPRGNICPPGPRRVSR